MEENDTRIAGRSGDKSSQISTCFAVVLIFTAAVNIISNVLVLVILSRNNRLRTCTNFFIANLCVIDLIAGIVLVPASIDSLLTQTPEPPQMSYKLVCEFYGFINSFYGIASSLTVAVIALDRYHSILNCLRYEIIVTQRRTAFVIAWTWLQAILVSLCPLVGWGHFSLNPNQYCSLHSVPDKSGFIFFKTITCVILPYFITVFCYVRIHVVARRHARTIVSIKVRDATNNTKAVKLSSSKKTIMVYIVLGVYTICWIPLYALKLLINVYHRETIPEQLLLTAIVLTQVNSACNPIMYALITSQFRNGLKRVYRRIRRSVFAGDTRQMNQTGQRGDSRSSWTFTRSSAKKFLNSQEQARPKLVLDPACAIIREESSLNTAGITDKTDQLQHLPAAVFPLTLQVPDEKWHKKRKGVKPVQEISVKKNGWIGPSTSVRKILKDSA